VGGEERLGLPARPGRPAAEFRLVLFVLEEILVRLFFLGSAEVHVGNVGIFDNFALGLEFVCVIRGYVQLIRIRFGELLFALFDGRLCDRLRNRLCDGICMSINMTICFYIYLVLSAMKRSVQ